nr:immunoglobulin light chain junction region [Macaca mulatta]
CMQALDYPPTF